MPRDWPRDVATWGSPFPWLRGLPVAGVLSLARNWCQLRPATADLGTARGRADRRSIGVARADVPSGSETARVPVVGQTIHGGESIDESPGAVVCTCVPGRREWPGTWSPATRGPSWPSPVGGVHVCVGRSRCHGNGSLPVARCPLLTRRTGCGSDPGDRTIGAGSAGISETTPGRPGRRRRLPGGGVWRAAEGCASDPSRGSESHGIVYENNPASPSQIARR